MAPHLVFLVYARPADLPGLRRGPPRTRFRQFTRYTQESQRHFYSRL
jgi:hypothetical protein